MTLRPRALLLAAELIFSPAAAFAADPPATTQLSYTRQQDVVYGRSYGAALTMDVFRPTGKPNGAAVIAIVSGGWVSAHEAIDSPFFSLYLEPFTRRGYTLFAVCHACQPKFTIPEVIGNINRSVRYVRSHAKDYGIDPDRIGVTGGSAGGHLSLMQAYAPQKENENAADRVDRTSAKVQVVACFFPPTDFLNYGEPGAYVFDNPSLRVFRAAFDFEEMSRETHRYERVMPERARQIEREISPFYAISKDSPPTLIAHGDADTLVPIQQAQIVIDKLKELNVPAELIVHPGAGHGWANAQKDIEKFADWFDKYIGREQSDEKR
jgi:acetyl esterase/lipase